MERRGLQVEVVVFKLIILLCFIVTVCGLNLTSPTHLNDDCNKIQCPEVKECPPDSYRLPAILDSSQETCCPPFQNCHCNPGLLCPSSPKCSDGSLATPVTNLTGQPGNCCPLYKCTQNEEGGERVKSICSYNGQIYGSGEFWEHEADCTECNCHHGVVSCKPMQCDVHESCTLVRALPGSCCPVCIGCIGNSGAVHNNSDIWEEDPCTTCECTEGRIKCHAAMCQTTCLNPRHIAGECCPRCDNGPECPIMDCHRECPNGFRLSKAGCPTCKCNKCRSLADCVKECQFGFETNEKGCPICHCRLQSGVAEEEESEEEKGSIHVFHGIQVHQPALRAMSNSGTDLGLKCEGTWNGIPLLNGEEWSDGCRKCVCKNGSEMCSLITCPLPQCEHPVFYPGNCCPRCPGEHIDLFEHESGLSICQSSDGSPHINGETWKIGNCLTCTCHDGQVLCASPDCPPTPCAHSLIQKEGDCCLTCPHNASRIINISTNASSSIISNQSKLNCFSDDSQKVYADGEMWKVGACQSCICEDGQVHCFSGGKCLTLECERPILAKNQCCPICLGGKVEKVKKRTSYEIKLGFCNENNHTYIEGESWNFSSTTTTTSGTCKSCTCISGGRIECDEMLCPPPLCSSPTLLEGKCCPICFESKSRKRVTISNDLNPDPDSGSRSQDEAQYKPSNESIITTTEFSQLPIRVKSKEEDDVMMSDDSKKSGVSLRTGLEPHCAIIITVLIAILIFLTLYIIRSCFFHRTIRLTKKMHFHSSNSSTSPPVTPDCCYKYTNCAQISEQKTPLCHNTNNTTCRNINSSDKV